MRNNRTGSRIFMTELMFSILYFIIIAAVCVQCFAGSYAMSRDAKEITNAVNIAGNAAEEFLVDDSFDNFTEYYDSDWKKTDDANSVYKTTGIVSSDYGNYSLMVSLSVTVTKMVDDSEVYSLNVKKALPLED